MNSIFKATISSHRMKRAIRCSIFCILLSGYTLAQDRVATDKIWILFNAKDVQIDQTLQHGFYLVQLEEHITNAHLQKNSVQLIRRISPEYAIVSSTRQSPLKKNSLIKKVFTINDDWKMEESLRSKEIPDVDEFFIQVTHASGFVEFLKSKNVVGHRLSADVFRIRCNIEFIRSSVIKRSDVIYIGSEQKSPSHESRVLELNLSPNHINQVHHFLPELNGEGMNISIKEPLFNIEDIDLKGRWFGVVVPEAEYDNHSTDMATIAAGAGNSFITGKGPAWKANITPSSYNGLTPDAASSFVDDNVWVQNHSYGTTIENFYGALARAYDQQASEVPQLLHVYSSGNEGTAASTQGQYQGISGVANLTGNFKMSKNTLSVAAVDTTRNVVNFSSRGPAFDGRIKPELAAFSVQGTSNSAALVSGTAVLIQQAYKNMFAQIPPSALLKALLINSAEDAGVPGIDFVTGFGNMDGFRAIQNLQSNRFISGSVGHGEIKSYPLAIPAGAKNLKVSIVWNDPAANANASKALVNDIDLRLVTNTATYLPWILNPAPGPQLIAQQATRGIDHLNNVEQITLDQLVDASYTLEVQGFDIPQGPQLFYIAYQWDDDQSFEWKFPTGSDNFPYNGETATYFYWKSTLSQTSGQLEYTIDNGANWIVIDNQVDLTTGYLRWNNPPPVNKTATARMVVGSESFPTEKFVISYPPQTVVAFNCSDSLMLRWDKIEGANSYQLYALSQKFMEPQQITTDTAIILYKNDINASHYAMEPILPDGKRGLRAPAVNPNSFGVGCYLLSFYAEPVAEDGIYLNTLLGTTHGVTSVRFEREKNGQFMEIGEVTASSETVRFLDENPLQGINRYRSRIIFQNGTELLSETVEEFFLTEKPFAVFPNPIAANNELRIFSKAFVEMNFAFKLFKSDGSLVASMDIVSDREFIPLNGIPAGMYIYHLTSEEGRFIGKLVVY